MGNKTSINKGEFQNSTTEKIIYNCKCKVFDSNYKDIKQNENYEMKLFENDLMLVNNNSNIYLKIDKISSWLSSKVTKKFGLYYFEKKKMFKIIFNLDEPEIISKYLSLIIHR